MTENGNRSDAVEMEDSTTQFCRAFEAVLQSGLGAATSNAHNGTTASDNNNLENIRRTNAQALIQLHELVSSHQLRAARAPSLNLTASIAEIMTILRTMTKKHNDNSVKVASEKLVKILGQTRLTAMTKAYDDIANRRFEPVLPEVPHEVDEDEGVAMKIVRLVRNNEPLGATIKCEPDGTVVIARVMKGGVADRSACIQIGDRVVEVNGVSVTGKQPVEIVKLLATNNRTVTFKLVPADDAECSYADAQQGELQPHTPLLRAYLQDETNTNRRVRALFDYNAAEDTIHPCPEAALSFHKGDILELVECHDDNWWQATREQNCGLRCLPNARHVPDDETRVGLIPSKSLQERRMTHQSRTNNQSADVSGGTLDSSSGSGGGRRLRRLMYDTSSSQPELGSNSSLLNQAYEDVALLYPRPGLIRPIVLIGPAGVGRNELQRRLLLLDSDRFGSTVPHTSRQPKQGEMDGVDYHFASRSQMEQWIKQCRFIEYGEYKGNIYGTLSDTVLTLMNQGRTPVLTPHPQALRLLRSAAIKPYIVFVKPPPFPTLKETRSTARARSLIKDGSYSRGFSDDELKSMLRSATQLEHNYGHLFDYVLVNGNLEFAFRELCDVLRRLDTQPQWVPTAWIVH